ncbi:hypothetical protein KIF59_06050 [Enterobacter cloacae subsp. cloacae]|nr:hypothetical protein [Enterobacter cloacae subsp. cloacae]
MYKEVNTGTNLPAQIDLYSVDGGGTNSLHGERRFANKTYTSIRKPKALITPAKLKNYLVERRCVPHGYRGLSALPYYS